MSLDFYDVLQQNYDESKTETTLARSLNSIFPELSEECIRSRIRRWKAKGNQTSVNQIINRKDNFETSLVNVIPKKESFEYRSDGVSIFEKIICLKDGEDLTPEKVLEAHGMDKSKWEIISCKSNFYQQQKKGGDILNLYQSKITAKPVVHQLTIEDVIDNFKDLQNTFVPRKEGKPNKHAHYLYEINIADLHLGKFCTEEETGEFLNSDLAEKRFFELIDKEVDNIKQYGDFIEKILFVWTNDFFNSDGISGSTTGGTPQDTDMKWQKLYLRGVNMLIKAIDILSQYAPVKTFYIASNHSRQVDYYAICTLNAWFRNYNNVEIDLDPAPRYYERYGVNLIGFAHSYYEKKANLPHLMQIERAKDWGETTYREYHLAHYHSEKVEEKGGIIFRWLPSITGTDTWSNDCGYIGAVKRSYSFVYDKEKGLIQINSTVID